MSVEIKIYGEHAREALDELKYFASGLAPSSEPTFVGWDTGAEDRSVKVTGSLTETGEIKIENVEEVPAPDTVGLDTRPIGAPSEGKSRRNSTEKTDDEQLEALATAKGVTLDQLNSAIADGGRHKTRTQLENLVVDEKPQISSGENRASPEDAPEVVAQDKADEEAEVEANRDAEKVLTVDDLKSAMTAYVTKHGMAAAQEDGPGIFRERLGNPPEGEEFWKLSLVAKQGQKTLEAAINAWREASESADRHVTF